MLKYFIYFHTLFFAFFIAQSTNKFFNTQIFNQQSMVEIHVETFQENIIDNNIEKEWDPTFVKIKSFNGNCVSSKLYNLNILANANKEKFYYRFLSIIPPPTLPI